MELNWKMHVDPDRILSLDTEAGVREMDLERKQLCHDSEKYQPSVCREFLDFCSQAEHGVKITRCAPEECGAKMQRTYATGCNRTHDAEFRKCRQPSG